MQSRYLDIIKATLLRFDHTVPVPQWTKHPQHSGTNPETPADRQTLRNPQG